MILLTLFLLAGESSALFGAFEKQSQVITLGDWMYAPPLKINVDPGGNLWFLMGLDSKIFKASPHGELLFDLATQGQGPGEIEAPTDMALVADGRYLLTTQMNGRMILFETATGKYVKTLGRLCPAGMVVPWDGESFAMINCGTTSGRDLWLHRFSNDGVLINESVPSTWWHEYEKEKNGVMARYLLGAVYEDTLFVGDFFMSEIWQLKGKKPPVLWKLKYPKFYREAPDKPLSQEEMWNQKKAMAWTKSFTHFNKLVLVGKHYLGVQWAINEPYPYSIDIYDLHIRKPIIQNVRTDQSLHAAQATALFLLEEVEAENLEEDDQYFLTRVELVLP